jgi:hypothetical protein
MAWYGIGEDDVRRCILDGISNKRTTFNRTSKCLSYCDGAINFIVVVYLNKNAHLKIPGVYDIRETEVVEIQNEIVEVPSWFPSCDHYHRLQEKNYDQTVATLEAESARFTEVALLVVHTPNYSGCEFVNRWLERLPVSLFCTSFDYDAQMF